MTNNNFDRFTRSVVISKTQIIFIGNVMRKIIEKQQKLGQVPISKIKIDINSRDEITQRRRLG